MNRCRCFRCAKLPRPRRTRSAVAALQGLHRPLFHLIGATRRTPGHHLCRREKVRLRIQFALFLEQLVFLDDVEDIDIQFLKTAVTRSELRNFFEANIRANAERL